MKRNFLYLLLSVAVVLYAGCSGGGGGAGESAPAEKEQPAATTAAKTVEKQQESTAAAPEGHCYQLRPDMVDEYINKGAAVLDVRQPQELNGPLGEIPGAVNIPLGELASRVGDLDRNRGYIVVCRTGHRSIQACRFLASKGFGYVYNIQGGMMAYDRFKQQVGKAQ